MVQRGEECVQGGSGLVHFESPLKPTGRGLNWRSPHYTTHLSGQKRESPLVASGRNPQGTRGFKSLHDLTAHKSLLTAFSSWQIAKDLTRVTRASLDQDQNPSVPKRRPLASQRDVSLHQSAYSHNRRKSAKLWVPSTSHVTNWLGRHSSLS